MLDGVDVPGELLDAWTKATGADDSLTALGRMGALRDALNRWEASLARDALAGGASWSAIGGELGDRGADAADEHDDERTDRPAWADTVADLLSDVTERITALGTAGWPWRSNETVDRTVAVDGATPLVIDNRAGSIKVRAGGS